MSATPDEVVDRLELLAAKAPHETADPDLLWGRGRRRQRRRTASVLAGIAAVGVLATAATPVVLERIDRPVAAASSAMVLPDVVREPGAWGPAFPTAPGSLSAVGVGRRSGLLSASSALWGVSAATGESRWLDLADQAPASYAPPQLSADGNRLAYWVTGPTSGEPVGSAATRRGEVEEVVPVVGVAVMDLETGEVARWDIASEYGLSVHGLAWAGDVLWWQGGPEQPLGDGASSAEVRTHTWDLATDERVELGGGDAGVGLLLAQAGDAPGGYVTLPRSFRLEQVTGAQAPEALRMDLPPGTPSSAGLIDPEMAPDGQRVAALMLPYAAEYDSFAAQDLLVGTRSDGTVALRPVGGVRAQSVLGWRSPTVVVVGVAADRDGDGLVEGTQASLVDVTDASLAARLDIVGDTPVFAADAWAGDVITAPDAPFAPDPRLVGAGGMVVLVFGVSLWRDLRRRRGHP